MLKPRLEVNAKMPPLVMVVHLMLNIHVHAAQCVHHLLGGVNIQHQIMVGLNAQKFVYRGNGALRPAGLIGRS